MGLVSFWSNITGPRVKEISPQTETPWLERGRPSTSAGTRFGKRRPGSTGDELDKRPTTANGEKQSKRLGRSLSRPRGSYPVDSESPRKPSVVEGDVEKDVPDLPALPASFSQDNQQEELPTPEESFARPGTALTTEGLQELQIFELPADPISTEASSCNGNPLIRKRSKSPVSASRSPKTGQWFRIGAGKNKALPPPPPPRGPLPPIPNTTSAAQRPVPAKMSSFRDDRSHCTIVRRTQSSASRSETKPRFIRSSSEYDFVLGAFPAAPALVHDDERTPGSSVTNSEASSVASPTHERAIFSTRKRHIPGPIKVNTAPGHMHKDSAIGTPSPFTLSGVKRWTRHVEDAEDDDDGDVTGWTEVDLWEWDEVSQFMESMQRKEINSGGRMMRGFEMDADRTRAVNSNEQALAELHFGVLK